MVCIQNHLPYKPITSLTLPSSLRRTVLAVYKQTSAQFSILMPWAVETEWGLRAMQINPDSR